MKQNSANTISIVKKNHTFKTDSKYSKIIEAFEYYKIIQENSHAKVTVKFNNGGILFIEVEDRRVFK